MYLHLAVLAVEQIPPKQGNALNSMGKKKEIPTEAPDKINSFSWGEEMLNTSIAS